MPSFPSNFPGSTGAGPWHFLIYIQVSQEEGKVVWYSHLLKNFPQFVVIHIVRGFGIVNEAEDVFRILAFSVIHGCWQFDLWFLCLF